MVPVREFVAHRVDVDVVFSSLLVGRLLLDVLFVIVRVVVDLVHEEGRGCVRRGRGLFFGCYCAEAAVGGQLVHPANERCVFFFCFCLFRYRGRGEFDVYEGDKGYANYALGRVRQRVGEDAAGEDGAAFGLREAAPFAERRFCVVAAALSFIVEVN